MANEFFASEILDDILIFLFHGKICEKYKKGYNTSSLFILMQRDMKQHISRIRHKAPYGKIHPHS